MICQYCHDEYNEMLYKSCPESKCRIEQLERENEELKKSSKWYCDYANSQDAQICEEIGRCNEAEVQNVRYREALEKIADRTRNGTEMTRGAIAREALERSDSATTLEEK